MADSWLKQVEDFERAFAIEDVTWQHPGVTLLPEGRDWLHTGNLSASGVVQKLIRDQWGSGSRPFVRLKAGVFEYGVHGVVVAVVQTLGPIGFRTFAPLPAEPTIEARIAKADFARRMERSLQKKYAAGGRTIEFSSTPTYLLGVIGLNETDKTHIAEGMLEETE